MNEQSKSIDPLTLSIIEGRLETFNEELGQRTMRQCFSYMTAHLRDLGAAFLDNQERIISVGSYMPGHSAGTDIGLKGILDYIGRDNIRPDDFIIGNDPFIVALGHVPDWTFVRPIFYEGELIFYHVFKTHQYDTGGAHMGAYYPGSFDCHGEGLLIPPLKLVEEGKLDEKVHSLILRNVRGASLMRADNLLVYTSMKKIEERVLDLLKTYGKDTVLAACDELIRRTEATVKNVISTWPAGTYRAERGIDWDGTTDKTVWLRLNLTIKPDEGLLILDFSDSDPEVDFVNITIGRTWAAMACAVAWTLPSGIPRNQGLINCMRIITKKGTVLDPVYPATSGGQVVTAGVITECALIAFGQAVPKETSALWTRHLNPKFSGKRRDRIDPRTGSIQYFDVAGFMSDGGNGAIYGYDGTDSFTPYNAAGAVLKAPVEVEEWEAPLRWLRYEFLTDATGHGQWRGGLGTHVEIVHTYDPKLWQPHDTMVMTGNFDGEKFGALGLMGGKEGKTHKMGILRRGKRVRLRTMSSGYLEPGDIVWTKSGGGGGVGDPLDREIEKVRWDLMNEYISHGVTRNVYGVVIDPQTFVVDYKATKALRQRLKRRKNEKEIQKS
ncbi:MAG TPA: hydantoinase B/oxoprolinase family protein [Desulfatiglandales bacterium]|nr:hydantoinase B/oxoprolinase family protein [Desulfatiglandales bacterium]